MIKVEIETTKTKTRSGVSKRTGNDYSITEQAALMFKEGERHPDKISINLDSGQPPYQVGVYLLDDSSYGVSNFGGIEVRPVLVPFVASLKQAS